MTDDGVDAETSLSLSLSLHFCLSSPPLHKLHFFLTLTFAIWSLKLSLRSVSPWANSKIVTSFSKSSGPRFDRLDGSRMIKEKVLEG